MLASVLIIAVSTVLFFYWFRYTCELILSARTSASFVLRVSEANNLSWAGVASGLDHATASGLAEMRNGLHNDHSKLDRILNRDNASQADQFAFERGMLKGYFFAASALFKVAARFSERTARSMVQTMARVVEHQVNLIGEQAYSAELSLS